MYNSPGSQENPKAGLLKIFLLSYEDLSVRSETFPTIEKIGGGVTVVVELVVGGQEPAMSYCPNLRVSPKGCLRTKASSGAQFENCSLIGKV